jgi:hypothetical protein
VNQYVDWGLFGDVPRFSAPDDLHAAGLWPVWDGSQAVDELTATALSYPQVKDFSFWNVVPGEPLEHGARRLEYIISRVAPEVRRRLANAG